MGVGLEQPAIDHPVVDRHAAQGQLVADRRPEPALGLDRDQAVLLGMI